MIKVWFILTRPLNVLITFCAVFIGAIIAGSLTPLADLIFAMCSAAMICAGGNVLNDYFDVDIDRINKPSRPLPSGRVKRQHALVLSLICLIAGLVISIFINTWALIIAIAAIALLASYNSWLKRKGGLVGNIMVSVTGALPIAYGGAAVARIEGMLFPTMFAFLLHLGREIIKDLEDVVGDKHSKSRSIPTRFSAKASFHIAFAPLLLLFLITPLPYLFHWYNIYYLIIVVPLVNLLLLISFFRFRNRLDPKNLSRLSTILKLGMVFGLLSLIIGTLHPSPTFFQ